MLNWTPAALWAALIFYLSSKPGLRVATGFWDFATRKPAHIAVYFILFLLIYYALVKTISKTRTDLLMIAFVLTVIYGISDEVHQIFVPQREGKIVDIGYDSIGALAAVILLNKSKTFSIKILNKKTS